MAEAIPMLSTGSTNSISKIPISSTTPTPTSSKESEALPVKADGFQAAQKIIVDRAINDKKNAILNKYHSVSSLQKHDKIEALKDPKLNPHLLDNPYDSLSNSLHRWTTLTEKIDKGYYTPEEKSKIASNYYDREIAPYYAGMKVDAMPKSVWLANAFTNAKRYKIEDMYSGTEGDFIHALGAGVSSGIAQLDRAGVFAVNMLGNQVHMADFLRKQAEGGSEINNAANATERAAWHNKLLGMRAKEHEDFKSKGLFATLQEHTDAIPVLKNISKFLNDDSMNSEFWKDVNPTRSFKQRATSFVSETAVTLPLFQLLGGATESLAAGSKTVPIIKNLTKVLDSTKGGKYVAGLLTSGGEGLAYGTLTRLQEDKNKAWQDALSFAALHTLFSLGGEVASNFGRKGKTSLGDMIDSPGVPPEFKEKFSNLNDRLKMSVEEGKRPATKQEKYDAHKAEVASNITAVGSLGQKAIVEQALDHIKSQEGRPRDSIRELNASLMQEDPAHWSPVLSMGSYIRSLLGERKLSDILAKPDSKDFKYLHSRINQLLEDASHSLDSSVPQVQTIIKNKAAKLAEGQKAAAQIQRIAAKLKDELATHKVSGVSDEQILEQARKEYSEASAKSAQRAEQARNSKPIKDANEISSRRRDVGTTHVDAGSYRERTRFTVNKKGEPGVSYSFNKEYRSYLKKAAGNLDTKYLRNWFQDLSAEDFNKDLEDYFYPQWLKDNGVYFEHESGREGVNNPNFLAFMYNYKDQMPKELGDEIGRRIQDTPKFEKFFKGSKDIEEQLRFYALQMYNHVDDFLASGRFPKEKNIFRSTQSDLLNPTTYQHELLAEREAQERSNIKWMFKKGPKRDAAMAAYDVLATDRRINFSSKSTLKRAERVRSISDEISETQVQQSSGRADGLEFIPF